MPWFRNSFLLSWKSETKFFCWIPPAKHFNHQIIELHGKWFWRRSTCYQLQVNNLEISWSLLNYHKLTKKSSEIGDASFIGLDCPSGNVDDCNDATVESAPPGCKGALIFSEEESQCGSKCNLAPQLRSSSNGKRKKWWTLFTRQAYWIR